MRSVQTATLESLVRRGTNASEPEMKAALTRLQSEIRSRLREESSQSDYEFFRAASGTLARVRGNAQLELRTNCLQDCGQYFYVSGHPEDAIRSAEAAGKLAQLGNHKLLLRKSESLLGIVYSDVGSIAESLIHYSRALTISAEIGDTDGEIRCLLNIGVALNYAGLFGEAYPCFEKAKQMSLGIAERDAFYRTAQANLAQTYYFVEEFEKGLLEIQGALAGAPEPASASDAISRTVKEVILVQLAAELGQWKLARDHASNATRYGAWGNSRRGSLLAKCAVALCEVHAGDAMIGLQQLEEALKAADGLPAVRRSILISLVRAFDAVGQPANALRYLRELLAHIRSVRQENMLRILGMQKEPSQHPRKRVKDKNLAPLLAKEMELRTVVAEGVLVDSRIEMLERLSIAADLREESSGEHGYRVGCLARLLSIECGLDIELSRQLEVAARLHDIGKVGVPDRILLTSEELKEAERHLMSSHTVIGAELLAKSDIPQLRMAEEIARCHHEWWNGTGYPAKLSGKRIPLHAQIVAIADVFDAITHGRPYEQPWPFERAIEQIRALRGEQFDPEITDRFLQMIERLRREHADLDEYLGRAGRNSPFLLARRRIREMLASDPPSPTPSPGNRTQH